MDLFTPVSVLLFLSLQLLLYCFIFFSVTLFWSQFYFEIFCLTALVLMVIFSFPIYLSVDLPSLPSSSQSISLPLLAPGPYELYAATSCRWLILA